MSTAEYQRNLSMILKKLLADCEVETEWRTKMKKGIYSPRVDVATGPFAIEGDVRRTQEHLQLFNNYSDFFSRLAEQHLKNIGVISEEMEDAEKQHNINLLLDKLRDTNMNARCFLAIELENKISRKHLMGGGINAAVLGKVGIAVGYSDDKHRAFLNLYRYFEFLQNVNKPTFNTSNLLIISAKQLIELINR